MVESITPDVLNRFERMLNLDSIKNREDLDKMIREYASKSGQGNARLPYELYEEIVGFWQTEVKPRFERENKLKEFKKDLEDNRIRGIEPPKRPKLPSVKKYIGSRIRKIQRVRQIIRRGWSSEKKAKTPKKERKFRKRKVGDRTIFEAKLKGKFRRAENLTYVKGYSYKRNNKTIRVPSHLRRVGKRKKSDDEDNSS